MPVKRASEHHEEWRTKERIRGAKRKRYSMRILNIVIIAEKGNLTLILISLNHDNVTSKDSRGSITDMLQTYTTHIAEIQETHILYGQDYMAR